MLKALPALLLLFSSAALADVDAHFSKGVLEIDWASSLQEVRARFPSGTAWPGNTADGEVVFTVPGDFRLLNVAARVPLVQFVFSKENQLIRAFFHFRLADREAALYGIAEVLGQDYTVRDENMSRLVEWKPGRVSLAKFELGSGPEFPWAYFAVRALDGRPSADR